MTTLSELSEILFEQMQYGTCESDIVQTLYEHQTKVQKRLEWIISQSWFQRAALAELGLDNQQSQEYQAEIFKQIDARIENEQ